MQQVSHRPLFLSPNSRVTGRSTNFAILLATAPLSCSAREGLHLLTFAKSKSYRVHIFQYSYSTVKFDAVIISLVTIVRYISSFISSVPHLLFWSNDLFNKSVQWLKWVLTKILKYFWGNKLWVAKGPIMKTSFGHNFYVFWKYLTLSLRQKINFLRF